MKTFNLGNIVHVLGKFDPLTNSDLIHDQLSCFLFDNSIVIFPIEACYV